MSSLSIGSDSPDALVREPVEGNKDLITRNKSVMPRKMSEEEILAAFRNY